MLQSEFLYRAAPGSTKIPLVEVLTFWTRDNPFKVCIKLSEKLIFLMCVSGGNKC